ncbi:MAG TPA: hypothetical protein VNO75_04570 [Gemmatimonadaceae bacterium]|nr:hypothetical protein [Gemmatimonadaceae bacterium]
MRESLREIGVPARSWGLVAAMLGLSWLLPDMRQSVVSSFGLYATIAFACGMSGVVLTFVQAGVARKGAVVLVSLLIWAIAVGWLYLNDTPPGRFEWFGGIVFGFGIVLVPVVISAFFANLRSGPAWTFAQVTSLALLAAPLSDMVGLVLSMVIFQSYV